MEKSDHYYIRKQRMRDLEAPVMSEVRQELGDNLTEALFKICPNALKPTLGLTPMLSGAGDDLWISPSDMMIGKVVLKPPLTSKYMKALTHQGILTIGHDVEKKFLCEFDLDKQSALREQEEMLLFIAELEQRKAMEEVREKERARHAEDVKRLMAEFEGRLCRELTLLEKKLKKHYTILMRRQKERLDDEWREKLENAVSEAVERLTDKFLRDMEAEEKDLLRRFEVEVKKEKIKTKMKMAQVYERSQDTYNQLKHQMRCKNISNIMYVLCMERRKCQAERDYIQAKFEERLQELRTEIAEKDEHIANLTADRDQKARQVNLREECLLEVLRQFQKFVNFALRSCPTQAEFLLSVEKMMIFELACACARTDQTRARRLVKMLLPWKEGSDEAESLVEKSSFRSLELKTPHECYNEIDTPVESEDRSLGSDDYLPGFHYNEHMYVREEFRNMMSQGIKLSPSNLIWNKDVEHMMNILRRPSDEVIVKKERAWFDDQETPSRTSQESTTIRTESYKTKSDDDDSSTATSGKTPSEKRPPRRSIVYFRSSTDENNFLFPIFESNSSVHTSPVEMYEEMSQATKSEKEEIIIEKECCIPCQMHPDHHVAIPDRGKIMMPLLGVKDSVEILKPSSDTGLLCAQDSLHKHRMSLKPIHTTMVSRESIAVSEILNLGKRVKRSAEDIHKLPKGPSTPPEDVLSLDMHRPSLRRTSKDSKIQFCLREEKPSRPKPLDNAVGEKLNLTLSKLSLARDSIIINKRSLILKKDPMAPIKRPDAMSDRSSEEMLQLKRLRRHASDNFSEHQSFKWGTGSDGQESHCTVSFHELSNTRDSSLLDVPIPTSKITLSRDSLDLIRTHSKTSTGGQLKGDSKNSIEIRNEILFDTHYPTPIAHIKGDPSKAVRISHFVQPSKASSPPKNKKTTIKPGTDSPWLVYQCKEGPLPVTPPDTPQRENFLTKPNVACVVGDQQSTSGKEKSNKFAIHRAESLLAIFRKNSSLIKLFTSCSQ